MLIKNAIIITQNKNREIIPRGFIRIESDSIVLIGSGDYKGDFNSAEEIIDASGYVVFPGFINAHVHLGETIYADFTKGCHDLEAYLSLTNRISNVSHIIENERRAICDYSLLQLIKNGTTTIAGGRTNESSEAFGIRNVSGYMLMQSPKLGKFSQDIENQFETLCKRIDQSLTRPALFIHSLGTVTEEILSIARDLKKKHGDLLIMAHVAETKKVEAEAKKRFDLTSVQTLQKYGLLDEQSLLVHGNNLSLGDIPLIRHAGASLVHCLSSNLRVADNVADIRSLMQRGIPVSIATDGVTTAGTFSVLSEARRCYLYHNKSREKQNISAQETLDMITINPARALGMPDVIGSIESGKKADFVFLRAPLYSTSQVINDLLSDDSMVVEGVMAGGKKLLWNNKPLIEREKEIVDTFFRVVENVRADIMRAHLSFE